MTTDEDDVRRRTPTDEPRQAVVFIHGIGNQEPMRTLRSFTQGIGLRRLFSAPDRTSGSDELRRLSEPPSAQRRASTDFYEFYWAHLAPDAGARASIVWAVRLFSRRDWWRRRGAVARLGMSGQVLTGVAVVLLGWGLIRPFAAAGWAGWSDLLRQWQVWLGLVAFLVQVFLGHFLRTVVSDAMRYLTPQPSNIASRRRIREEGLRLLRRLHADERYVRIVVVGHSLGTVIAYDLLRCLWDELRHPDPSIRSDQAGIDAFDAAADRIDPSGQPPADGAYLRPGASDPGDAPIVRADEVAAFQLAQHDLWLADRRDGVPWLVTDFVSLGSPLTYADLLLQERPDPLGGRRGLTLADQQALKEFPRCPPIRDELEDSRFYTREYVVDGATVQRRVGHTAAPFGPTRWTNLFIPARSFLRGDFVAGPLSPAMGPGVADVPVVVEGGSGWTRVRRHFPAAHISYWWRPRVGDEPVPRPPRPGEVGGATGHGAHVVHPGGGASFRPDRTVEALLAALRLDDITTAPPR